MPPLFCFFEGFGNVGLCTEGNGIKMGIGGNKECGVSMPCGRKEIIDLLLFNCVLNMV